MNETAKLDRLVLYLADRPWSCSECGLAVHRLEVEVEGVRHEVAFQINGAHAGIHRCGDAPRPPRNEEAVLRGLLLANAMARPCRGKTCSATLYWLKTPSGSRQCFELDGEVHWARCPDARDFQRGRVNEKRGRDHRRRGR